MAPGAISNEAARLRRNRTALLLFVATLPGFVFPLPSRADVVRRAPSFTFGSAGGTQSLASLRGKAVILLVASSAKSKALRKQVKNLKPVFHDLASRGTIFVAAVSGGDPTVPSDIPFALASNGQAVASAYRLSGDFLIAVIGPDGNLDLQSDKPLPGLRVVEVTKNNFQVQDKARREIPKAPGGR